MTLSTGSIEENLLTLIAFARSIYLDIDAYNRKALFLYPVFYDMAYKVYITGRSMVHYKY